MSMPQDRRRGGAAVKVTAPQTKPSKNLTPTSEKSMTGIESINRSTGKENPRPTSRVRGAVAGMSQKPAMRPMARIDKLSAFRNDGVAVAESRVRWSTSSVPRGRSSSPSDFNRVLTDLRNDRVSRVSAGRSGKAPAGEIDRSASRSRSRVSGKVQQKKCGFGDSNGRGAEGCENGARVLKGYKDSVNVVSGAKRTSEKTQKMQETEISGSKETKLSSILRKSSDGSNFGSKSEKSVYALGEESKGRSSSVSRVRDRADKCENATGLNYKETISKEKSAIEESGAQMINKYPSKIHEKLAFLEGKVKRIASDIKRTKEMLDMNNPDASKVILSDIQEKISGIEKAICHVENAENIENIEKDTQTIKEAGLKNQTDKTKGVGKELDSDELEAKLLPRHKLLRDRTSLRNLLESSQVDELKIVEEPKKEMKIEDKLSANDENHIALELLASFSVKDQSKITRRGCSAGLEVNEVKEMDEGEDLGGQDCESMSDGDQSADKLLADEELDEFDDQENITEEIEEEGDDNYNYALNAIGNKTSTGGWFVSEGESVLLAHDDGSCSFYDIANCEQKSEYKPPAVAFPNIWRDCWILRAPGPDGCAGRYVVAASAGNATDSGFCSWDFYTKQVKAFHLEDQTATTTTRTALASLPNNPLYRGNPLRSPENRQWWYRPCGTLIASTASCDRSVSVYDIRDGERILRWGLGSNVLGMEYSSPLQWRNREKLVVVEGECVSLWDVSSQVPQQLMNVLLPGRKISALHVNNTDAELGGGVRQRVSSSEAEGNDGVFCTQDAINVLDFRIPSGIALKISKLGVNVQSVFARGDHIFLGCTSSKPPLGKNISPQIQQFSFRKQRLVSSYTPPDSNAPFSSSAITQVWGNSNTVMGLSHLGLSVFDAFAVDHGKTQNVKELIGPDDLYSPSFDYLGSRVLLISRDRPALWRYLS